MRLRWGGGGGAPPPPARAGAPAGPPTVTLDGGTAPGWPPPG
jgi:hypothetical protein